MEHRALLEGLVTRYHRREYVHPDPLEVLYPYENVREREVIALLASCLAYGRVSQILSSLTSLLKRVPSPLIRLKRAPVSELRQALRGFKHRWTTGDQMANLLMGVKGVLQQYGSLEDCFRHGLSRDDPHILSALSRFVHEIRGQALGSLGTLLPSPDHGSACKRLNLFLRWMIRSDEVDPGGWTSVPPSKLVVPLDTHMHTLGLHLGLTRRKQADLRTALEVTEAFRFYCPRDPVRYDFALTRLGIRAPLEGRNRLTGNLERLHSVL